MDEIDVIARRRTVKGWAFMALSDEVNTQITAFLAGGPVPPGYERRYETEKELLVTRARRKERDIPVTANLCYVIWVNSMGVRSWAGPFNGNKAASDHLREVDAAGGSRVVRPLAGETPGERLEMLRLEETCATAVPVAEVTECVTWDWDDQVLASEVAGVLARIVAAHLTPHIVPVVTGNSDYCWVISSRDLTQADANQVYQGWDLD